MKQLSLITALFGFLAATAAFANGVDRRVLPYDAHNVHLTDVRLAQVVVGHEPYQGDETFSDAIEGVPTPSGKALWRTRIAATFAYDSFEDQPLGSGPDGQSFSWDDPHAHAILYVDASPATIRAIASGRMSARDAVRSSAGLETVRVPQYRSGGDCHMNYETGMGEGSECGTSRFYETETRMVVSVSVR